MSNLRVVLQALEAEGLGHFRARYSGRGMYGESCLGFDTDDPDEVKYRVRNAGIKGGSIDNMGLGWIVYWPGEQ